MSHIQLGWKVHDGHTFMPDSWYKFSARAPWFSSLWSLILQYTSLAFLHGGLRENFWKWKHSSWRCLEASALEPAQLLICHCILIKASHRPTLIQRLGKKSPSSDRGAARNFWPSQTYTLSLPYNCTFFLPLGIPKPPRMTFHPPSRHARVPRPVDKSGTLRSTKIVSAS